MAFRQLRTSVLTAAKPSRVLSQPAAVSIWARHLSADARLKIDNVSLHTGYLLHCRSTWQGTDHIILILLPTTGREGQRPGPVYERHT